MSAVISDSKPHSLTASCYMYCRQHMQSLISDTRHCVRHSLCFAAENDDTDCGGERRQAPIMLIGY